MATYSTVCQFKALLKPNRWKLTDLKEIYWLFLIAGEAVMNAVWLISIVYKYKDDSSHGEVLTFSSVVKKIQPDGSVNQVSFSFAPHPGDGGDHKQNSCSSLGLALLAFIFSWAKTLVMFNRPKTFNWLIKTIRGILSINFILMLCTHWTYNAQWRTH